LQIEDTQVYQFEYYEMDLISVNWNRNKNINFTVLMQLEAI
jgi:hypothetical protein